MGSRHQNALEEVEARPGVEPPPSAGAVGVRGLLLNSTSILLSPHIRLSCSQPRPGSESSVSLRTGIPTCSVGPVWEVREAPCSLPLPLLV